MKQAIPGSLVPRRCDKPTAPVRTIMLSTAGTVMGTSFRSEYAGLRGRRLGHGSSGSDRRTRKPVGLGKPGPVSVKPPMASFSPSTGSECLFRAGGPDVRGRSADASPLYAHHPRKPAQSPVATLACTMNGIFIGANLLGPTALNRPPRGTGRCFSGASRPALWPGIRMAVTPACWRSSAATAVTIPTWITARSRPGFSGSVGRIRLPWAGSICEAFRQLRDWKYSIASRP